MSDDLLHQRLQNGLDPTWYSYLKINYLWFGIVCHCQVMSFMWAYFDEKCLGQSQNTPSLI